MPAPPLPDAALAEAVADACRWLDATPSPYHCVALAQKTLLDLGVGTRLGIRAVGGMFLAWWQGPGATGPARIIAAHTDSPNLRIAPRPNAEAGGCQVLHALPYGSPLLASWFDRDLGLSGRVVLSSGDVRLLHVDGAGLRLPRLAIHLDRDVNERGHVVDRQRHLDLLWRLEGSAPDLASWLADRLDVAPADIVSWDLMTHDAAPATGGTTTGDLLSAGRLDNQISCWLAVDALAEAARDECPGTVIVALFDHEEVGSESATGAAGPELSALLGRLGVDSDRSMMLSADMAHAVHPHHLDRHEPHHPVLLGGGPTIKVDVNQRYATDAVTAAATIAAARHAGVSVQTYVHRADLPCGSTIGPIATARTGIPTVDVGLPMLAMHSARETMAAADLMTGRRLFRSFVTH